MSCKSVQKDLMDGRVRNRGGLERHLDECATCGRFAARLAIAEQALGDHHAGVTPPPAFAARVVARLPQPSPILGWAALRLLPAATALLLVLSAWAFFTGATRTELVAASPTDDLVSWVLEDEGVTE